MTAQSAWRELRLMPKGGPPTVTLTAYLLKPSYTTPRAALRASLTPEPSHDPIADVGDLYTSDSHPHAPKWAMFFGAALPSKRNLLTSSASGVLIVRGKTRLFAVTFGYGKSLLDPGAWEDGFGLRVTLNSIDPAKIKSVDHKTFEAVTRHTRTQTSREGPTSDFGLDVERDLVRAVTGEPRDVTFGKRLTGMDALVFTAKLTVTQLPALLDRYLERSAAQDYKKSFGWIDNISEVRDPVLVAQLDHDLVARLSARNFDRLWLSIPDIVEWSAVGGFKYRRSDSEAKPDLRAGDFVDSIMDPTSITLDTLRKRHVYVMDTDGEKALEAWPIYRCIYCEDDRENQTYLLTGGKWYGIQKTFVATVNETISGLVSTAPALGKYAASDADEGAYNARIAAASGGSLALMDKKMIQFGGGHSQFEFCDLYSDRREMIHVKRYGGSSAPLSHLFSQGVGSAELWLGDPEFRKRANAHLPKTHKVSDSSRKPDPAAFTVVFAVVSRSKQSIDKSLPFFSRLALRNATQRLNLLGYPVALVKIMQP